MKVIITVDERGDLHVDFSGYSGRVCEFEEAELRRIMEEFGLKVKIEDFRSKVQSFLQHEQTRSSTDRRVKISG